MPKTPLESVASWLLFGILPQVGVTRPSHLSLDVGSFPPVMKRQWQSGWPKSVGLGALELQPIALGGPTASRPKCIRVAYSEFHCGGGFPNGKMAAVSLFPAKAQENQYEKT